MKHNQLPLTLSLYFGKGIPAVAAAHTKMGEAKTKSPGKLQFKN